MKLILSGEEIATLIAEALSHVGPIVNDSINLDLGDGNTLPLSLVQGVVVDLSTK